MHIHILYPYGRARVSFTSCHCAEASDGIQNLCSFGSVVSVCFLIHQLRLQASYRGSIICVIIIFFFYRPLLARGNKQNSVSWVFVEALMLDAGLDHFSTFFNSFCEMFFLSYGSFRFNHWYFFLFVNVIELPILFEMIQLSSLLIPVKHIK